MDKQQTNIPYTETTELLIFLSDPMYDYKLAVERGESNTLWSNLGAAASKLFTTLFARN